MIKSVNAIQEIGTLPWSYSGNGVLTKKERVRFFLEIAGAQIKKALKANDTYRFVDLSGLKLPDTKFVYSAFSFTESKSPTWLMNHCLRTWMWAKIIALHEGLAVDDEILALACILHDITLLNEPSSNCPCCFAVQSAWDADDFLKKQLYDPIKASIVANAICLHMNSQVDLNHGVEAHLLNAGAAMDVLGDRLKQINSENIKIILEEYPRLNFKTEFSSAIFKQHKYNKDSRSDLLWKAGFGFLIKHSKWND